MTTIVVANRRPGVRTACTRPSRILDKYELRGIRYFSNKLVWAPGGAPRAEFPNFDPLCKTASGTCKCSLARALSAGRKFLYVGDGQSDFCISRAASLVMILTASCQVERAELGTVVAARLRAGGLLDRERNALRAAHDRADADIGHRERIDERVALLLTWLHHAGDLCRKRATHPNQHIWWATNVAPVLDAVAAWHGSDGSSARARAGRGTANGAPMTTSPPVEDAAQAPGNQADG
jgi:hypothetical protein